MPLGNADKQALEGGLAEIRDFEVLAPLSKQFVTDVAEVGRHRLGHSVFELRDPFNLWQACC